MPRARRSPGAVRDGIIAYLSRIKGDASIAEIEQGVHDQIGEVSSSSVRSYLRLNPEKFERTMRGRYQLRRKKKG